MKNKFYFFSNMILLTVQLTLYVYIRLLTAPTIYFLVNTVQILSEYILTM